MKIEMTETDKYEYEYEYVPGFIAPDGRARVSAGVIAPGYVAQYIAGGWEVLRRRVGPFETVTADTVPLPNHCEECGAWGTGGGVHLRGCSHRPRDAAGS